MGGSARRSCPRFRAFRDARRSVHRRRLHLRASHLRRDHARSRRALCRKSHRAFEWPPRPQQPIHVRRTPGPSGYGARHRRAVLARGAAVADVPARSGRADRDLAPAVSTTWHPRPRPAIRQAPCRAGLCSSLPALSRHASAGDAADPDPLLHGVPEPRVRCGLLRDARLRRQRRCTVDSTATAMGPSLQSAGSAVDRVRCDRRARHRDPRPVPDLGLHLHRAPPEPAAPRDLLHRVDDPLLFCRSGLRCAVQPLPARDQQDLCRQSSGVGPGLPAVGAADQSARGRRHTPGRGHSRVRSRRRVRRAQLREPRRRVGNPRCRLPSLDRRRSRSRDSTRGQIPTRNSATSSSGAEGGSSTLAGVPSAARTSPRPHRWRTPSSGCICSTARGP